MTRSALHFKMYYEKHTLFTDIGSGPCKQLTRQLCTTGWVQRCVEAAVKFPEGAIIAVTWGLLAQGEGGHVDVVCMWVLLYLLTTFRD